MSVKYGENTSNKTPMSPEKPRLSPEEMGMGKEHENAKESSDTLLGLLDGTGALYRVETDKNNPNRILLLRGRSSGGESEEVTEESMEVNRENFTAFIEAFETKHNLDFLNAITTKTEAMESSERREAKLDLRPVRAMLRGSEGHDGYNEALQEWKKISQAVGMINGNTLYHDR